jgi:hypothetical protein
MATDPASDAKERWWHGVVDVCQNRSVAIREAYEKFVGPSAGVGVLPMMCELIRQKVDVKALALNEGA